MGLHSHYEFLNSTHMLHTTTIPSIKIKNIALLLLLCLPAVQLLAQNEGVLIDYVGNSRESKAIFQINSTTQGAILPRMLASERTAISPLAAAQEGLTVYQTDAPEGYYYWDGANWQYLASSTGSGYIQNLPVTNNFTTGQAASFDIKGDGEISGTLSIGGGGTGTTPSSTSVLDVNGGTAVSGSGKDINLQAQHGFASGNTNGGNVNITSGKKNGSGAIGNVNINTDDNIPGGLNIANGTATQTVGIANNSSGVKTVTIGGTGGASSTTINAGTGGVKVGTLTTGLVKSTAGVLSNGVVATDVPISNSLSLSTNTLTSTVNGEVATSSAISGVSNTSATNTLSTTVNGVTGTGVNIINSNAITLSGTSLTSTVNGIASTGLDITPAITAKAWSLTGNSSTTPSTAAIGSAVTAGSNFLGTADSKDLILATDNRERIRIASSGNVGIGTTAPTDGNLVVKGGNPILSIQNVTASGGSGGVLRFGHDQSSNTTPIAEIRGYLTNGSAARSGHLTFFTSNGGVLNERMRIEDGGNIRLNNYTTNGLLKTTGSDGTLAIATGVDLPSGSGSYIQNQSGPPAQSADFWMTGNGRFNTGSGPYWADNSDAGFVTFRSTGDAAGLSYLEIGTHDNGDEPIIFTQSNAERMRIHTNGYLGIGTTGPATRLHVNGGITMSAATNTDNASPALTANVGDDFLYNAKYLSHYGMGFHVPENSSAPTGNGAYMSGYYGVDLFSGGASRISVKEGGNVGIGTTNPGYKLQVDGDIYANGGWARVSGNKGLHFETWGGGWYMSDATWIRGYGGKSLWMGSGLVGGDGGLTIGYGGAGSPTGGAIIAENVGIGTTSPVAQLDVQGDRTFRQGDLTTYVKTFSTGPGTTTYAILRQFHDQVNWGLGGMLVEVFVHYYEKNIFDFGMFMARYGYSGNGADILTKISGGIAPYWGGVGTISGNIKYRDLYIDVPYYRQVTVRVTTPVPTTTNVNSPTQNLVYFY